MSPRSFESILKSKTVNAELPPKEDMWARIEPNLIKSGKRKRLVVILTVSALLVATGVVLNFKTASLEKSHELKNSFSEVETNSSDDFTRIAKQPSILNKNRNEVIGSSVISVDAVTENTPEFSNLSSSEADEVKIVKDKVKKGNFVSENVATYTGTTGDEDNSHEVRQSFPSENPGTTAGDIDGIEINASKEFQVLNEIPSVPLNPDTVQKPKPSSEIPRIAKRKNQFYVGITGGTIYSGSHFKTNGNPPEPYHSQIETREQTDRQIRGLSAGIFAGVEKGRKIVQFGLEYRELGYSMFVRGARPSSYGGSGTFQITTAQDKFLVTPAGEPGEYISNKYKYVAVPLTYSYNLLKPDYRLQIRPAIQLSYSFLADYEGLQQDSDTLVLNGETSDYKLRIHNLTASAGLDLRYRTNLPLAFSVSAMYGRSLFPVDYSQIKNRHAYMQIALSIIWRLN